MTALSLVFTALGGLATWQHAFRGDTIVRQPLQFGLRLNRISDVEPEAEAAGIPKGASVVSLNSRPFANYGVFIEAIRAAHPGDRLEVSFLTPDGAERSATITLVAANTGEPFNWLQVISQDILLRMMLPGACIALGFWVVLARPRDRSAWLLLGIFSYFPSIFYAFVYWPGAALAFTPLWGNIVNTAGPICIMLFGINFPQRVSWDIDYPWIKWVVIAPMLLLLPFDLWFAYGSVFRFDAVLAIARHIGWIFRVENILVFLAISLFFSAIARKLGIMTALDAIRRLKVLYIGSSVSNAPIAMLTLYSLARNLDLGEGVPQWLFVTAVAMFAFFPLTLAYVVVVQRAMDLRILIRQGTRYAFARQSVFALRVVLATLLSIALSSFFRHTEHHRNVEIFRIFLIIGVFFAFRSLLNKRLQLAIDQRFFREAYSAEQLLSELSDQVRGFTESGPLLDTVTQRIGSTLHIDRIAVFLRSGENFQLALTTGAALPTGRVLTLPAASATITTLARQRTPANVYHDDPSSWLVDATDLERNALADLSTELLVPLPGRNRLIGVIALGPKRSEEPYSRTDRQLLQSVASQTAFALENAELIRMVSTEVAQRERVSREIEIAREVQQRLFPQTMPSVPGIDLAGYCRPAYAVGGDYFDYFLIPATDGRSSRLALALGDISGKGVSAALLMASLRASLRSLAMLPPISHGTAPSLADIIARVNHLVYESSSANRYATFFYAESDPATRLLTYVNAGHNPPVILRAGKAIALEATGTVVGLLPDAAFEQVAIALVPGDVLLTFTDGISEAMTHGEEEWGEERMIACALERIGQPGCSATAQQLLDCILMAADKFTAGAPQHDDMTLLVCTIH